jgi:cobalt-zinc-cadmium resistance protein CzcA
VTVRLILRTAPGVDDVSSWGGGERQYQVQIDPQRLYARGLGFGDVINALPANNGQVGGNVMDVGREQFLVRGLGLLKSTEDIGAIVLKAEDGVPVYLRDVATVVEAPAPRFGAVTRDGQEVVMGQALARIGENAKDVVEAVKGKLDVVRDALPKTMVLKPIYERTDLVNKAVETAVRALVEGSLLVAVILFLFLGDPLGTGGDRHATAGNADCLHRHGAGRLVRQSDVTRGLGDRHRHDGGRRGGDGRERVPDHGRAVGARREGR